jgi:hypothetical protein
MILFIALTMFGSTGFRCAAQEHLDGGPDSGVDSGMDSKEKAVDTGQTNATDGAAGAGRF